MGERNRRYVRPLKPEFVLRLIDLGYEEENEIEELYIYSTGEENKSCILPFDSPKVLEYLEKGYEILPYITVTKALNWLGVNDNLLFTKYYSNDSLRTGKISYALYRWIYLKNILFYGKNINSCNPGIIEKLKSIGACRGKI